MLPAFDPDYREHGILHSQRKQGKGITGTVIAFIAPLSHEYYC